MPGDAPALAELGEQTPETGAVAFHSEFHVDPYVALLAIRPNTIGVVAEAPNADGLAGIGLMSFGECRYEEVMRPYAYLYSLSVHPRYRRQGLASRLAAWRVAQAIERSGEDVVVAAGMQAGNEGSIRTAQSWFRQRFDRVQAVVTKPRSRPPSAPAGLVVRPAEGGDFEEIAIRQNAFYGGYNLYPPQTAESLTEWRAQAPLGFPIHDYLVATDAEGDLVAGLALTEEGRLMSSRLVHMVAPLRIANLILQVVPRDGRLRRVLAESVWFAPGRQDAAAYLWESARWLWRDRGSMFMTFFDSQSSLARAIPLPRFMPRQVGTLVVRGPGPMDEHRPIYASI
jgi:GNAT superfamily N-acetyltransferase